MRRPALGGRIAAQTVRFLSVCLLTGFALLAAPTADQAAASKSWCRTDPIVLIDGHVTDIFVAAPLTAPLLVTGPTQVVVTVPSGVDAWLVLADLGLGRGEEVSFEESDEIRETRQGVEVRVAVYVPATDDAMPVMVEVAPRLLGILWPDRAEGVANEWVVVESLV